MTTTTNRYVTVLTAVLLATMGIARPAAAEVDLATWAQALYLERCGVDPDSSQADRAPREYAQLIALGYTPEEIHSLAAQLPVGCDYISLKAAVMGQERRAEQEAARTFQPPTEGLDETPRPLSNRELERMYPEREIPDPGDEITYDTPGVRGLRRSLHGAYGFGIAATVAFAGCALLGAGLTVAAANSWEYDCFFMWCGYGHDGDLVWASFGAWVLTGLFGTTALIMGIAVESQRERGWGYYRSLSSRPANRPRLGVGPGGLTLYF